MKQYFNGETTVLPEHVIIGSGMSNTAYLLGNTVVKVSKQNFDSDFHAAQFGTELAAEHALVDTYLYDYTLPSLVFTAMSSKSAYKVCELMPHVSGKSSLEVFHAFNYNQALTGQLHHCITFLRSTVDMYSQTDSFPDISGYPAENFLLPFLLTRNIYFPFNEERNICMTPIIIDKGASRMMKKYPQLRYQMAVNTHMLATLMQRLNNKQSNQYETFFWNKVKNLPCEETIASRLIRQITQRLLGKKQKGTLQEHSVSIHPHTLLYASPPYPM